MIDPGKIAQQKIKENWHKFGSILIDCEYFSVGSDSYDVATGQVTVNETSYGNVRVIFDEKNEDGFISVENSNVLKYDKLALIPYLDLSVTPKKNDRLVDPYNKTWYVIEGSIDPAKSLWTLKVRDNL